MSASGLLSIFLGSVVFVLLGSRCVDGRPQLLFEPSLESAASPAYLLPPRSTPPPPSPPSIHHQATGPLLNTLANQGTFPDFDNDDFSYLPEDLDGRQDRKWEQVSDAEEFDVPPTLRWPERTLSSPRGKGGLLTGVGNTKDFHGTRTRSDFKFNTDERKENAEALNLAFKDRDSSIETSDSFDRLHRIVDKGVQTPELTDTDTDERPLSHYSRLTLPDDIPADHDQIIPWQKMLENDVDVDKVIRRDSSPLQRKTQPASLMKADTQWKKLAQEEGRIENTELAHNHDDRAVIKENPFEDDQDNSNEVPQELIRQVVEAMDRPVSSFWRQGAPDGPKDEEDVWTEGSGNGSNGEEDDGYVDWMIQKRAKTHNSRLIALIFQTVDDDQEEDEEDSATAFDKELSIWQVLTNFPFPMLLSQGDSAALHVDYIYDDDDDYDDDDYDDDDYYDEFYSDEYDDYDDDDDEYSDYDDDDDNGRDDGPNESDEDLDDYFYSELYDDCDDCDGEEEGETAKQKAPVLSLPPMFTR